MTQYMDVSWGLCWINKWKMLLWSRRRICKEIWKSLAPTISRNYWERTICPTQFLENKFCLQNVPFNTINVPYLFLYHDVLQDKAEELLWIMFINLRPYLDRITRQGHYSRLGKGKGKKSKTINAYFVSLHLVTLKVEIELCWELVHGSVEQCCNPSHTNKVSAVSWGDYKLFRDIFPESISRWQILARISL